MATAGISERLRARLALAGLALAAGLPIAPAAASVPESARAEAAPDEGDPRVVATLLVDVARAAPGEPFRVGVRFELDRGWHLYWSNPGRSGLPTQLDFEIADAEVGPLQWPAPEVFREDARITTYGYSDEVVLFARAALARGATGTRQVVARGDFLVCEVRCIPGRFELARPLEVADAAEPAEADTVERFDLAASQLPVAPESLGLELDALYSQDAVRPGDRFRAAIAVLPCAGDRAGEPGCDAWRPGTRRVAESFAPALISGMEIETTGSRPHPFSKGFLVTLAGRATRDAPEGDGRLRGVLLLRGPGGRHAIAVDLPLPRAGAGAPVRALDNPWLAPLASVETELPWLEAVLLALLGGLVLNLMPCVLPVLAIKLFSVAELAHRSRRELALHGVAYTLGVLAAMAALAAVVAGLREAGTAVGWGFQFQEPRFVLAISAVLVLFAANLFGVFEITPDVSALAQAPDATSGLRRSALEGGLAVVVATPCSAPFLGTAIGFAFASDTPVIFAILLCVGLGLALPYLLVTCVPGWARFVPRPGAWMLRLRALLGIALLATVAWLLWVLGRVAGTESLTVALAFLVGVGAAAWLLGRLQTAWRDRTARGAAFVPLAVLALALVWLPLERSEAGPGEVAADADGFEARTFDPAAIERELAAGRAVFVYFTADWCLTCKLNERAVLADERVRDAFDRAGVVRFRADWTRRDESIRAELARFGRAGVPMYLLYPAGRRDHPQVLPELLTVDLLLEAVDQAGKPGEV
jgi:thiol:disulfide interchange protein DsbD